jgi:arginase
MSFGQPIDGTDRGPQLLRLAGLENALKSLDWTVRDDGDLDMSSIPGSPQSPGKPKNLEAVSHGNHVIFDAVTDAVKSNEFPVVMGGDHSVALGSVAAILKARPETGIIWIDAHADINTPVSSPSGNMHGMPVSFLMQLEGTQGYDELQWMNDVPKLRPEQIAYVGLRDIDEDERNILRQSGIQSIFTMHEIDKYGISRVMEEVLRRLDGRPLHVSYDVDAVDPMFAPATGTVVRGGLTYREAFYVAESITETGMLASVDMVEVNPLLASGEEANETVKLGLRLIEALLGGRLYEAQPALS